jgi:hypothetical protein
MIGACQLGTLVPTQYYRVHVARRVKPTPEFTARLVESLLNLKVTPASKYKATPT